MIYTYLSTAILSAALAFGSAWKIQSWRFDAHEKHSIEAAAIAQQEIHRMESRRLNNVLDAQNDRVRREAGIRADNDRLRTAAERLQSQSAAALLAANASHEACLVTATALENVFGKCTRDYGDLATTTDRHVSDIQTLSDAWPD